MSENAYRFTEGILTQGLKTLGGIREKNKGILERELDLEFNKKKLLQQYDPEVLGAKLAAEEQETKYKNSPYYLNILSEGEVLKNDMLKAKQDKSDRTFVIDPYNPDGPMIRKGEYYARESQRIETKKEAYKKLFEGQEGTTITKRLTSDQYLDDKITAVTYFGAPESILYDNTYRFDANMLNNINMHKQNIANAKKKAEVRILTNEKIREKDLMEQREYGDDALAFVRQAREFAYDNGGDAGFALDKVEESTYALAIGDAIEAAQGMKRINIKGSTINAIKDIRATNFRAPMINPRLPYLKFDTFASKHAKSGQTGNLSKEDITQYASGVFGQFTFFTDELLANMDSDAVTELQELFRNQLFVVKNNIGFQKGPQGSDVVSHVRLGEIGINLKNLPSQLRKIVTEATGEDLEPGDNIASAVVKTVNTKGEQDDTLITGRVSEIAEELKETVFFKSAGVPNVEDLMNSSSKYAYSIMNGVILDNVTKDNQNSQIVGHMKGFIRDPNQKLQVIANNHLMLPAAQFLYDVFYPHGNPGKMTKAKFLSGSNYENALNKVRKYSLYYSSQSPNAQVANIPHDIFEYDRTFANMIALAISDQALMSQVNNPIEGSFYKSADAIESVEDYIKRIVPEAYRNEAQRAATAGQNAERASISYLQNLDEYKGVSGQVTEGIITLIDDMKRLGGQFTSIIKGSEMNDSHVDSIYGGIRDKVNTMSFVPNRFATTEINDEQRANVGKNRALMSRLQEVNRLDFGKDLVGGISQRRMLHAALTFYAAAAFQGEGGKAISDGDRKFVEWALSYGTFTDASKRRYAIAGLMKIISKATVINELVASGDAQKVYVGMNHRQLFGRNTLSPEDWPDDLKKDIDGNIINWESFVNTNNKVYQLNVEKPVDESANLPPKQKTIAYGEKLDEYMFLEGLGDRLSTEQKQRLEELQNDAEFMNKMKKSKAAAERKLN